MLGEAIAAQLGMIPASIELGFRLLPTFDIDPLEQNVNYAVAGAATGTVGAAGNNLQILPVGLQTQVEIFSLDLITAGALLVAADERPDIILSAGSNDVFEALVDQPAFANILLSPETDDDSALMQKFVSQIVGNIEQAIARLEGLVDDVVILGIPKLDATPFAIQMDALVDDLLIGDFAGKTQTFLTATATEVNAQLSKIYDGDSSPSTPLPLNIDPLLGADVTSGTATLGHIFAALSDDLLAGGVTEQAVAFLKGRLTDRPEVLWPLPPAPDPVANVMVIDGISIFETGVDRWQTSLPTSLSPIIDLSYQAYVTPLGSSNPDGLPAGLVVEQFAFIDGVHSTEAFNLELAPLIAAQIVAEFPDFG
ncbi:MAG: hypothetical protein F6K00_15955 [Leptolyngbya sp. SIOISBB]|nr:hypothetical protein [Leptolyngbya sp. SIOISBB]